MNQFREKCVTNGRTDEHEFIGLSVLRTGVQVQKHISRCKESDRESWKTNTLGSERLNKANFFLYFFSKSFFFILYDYHHKQF